MSDHSETHEHEEHLEVYPDSGITETSKPIAGWLWVVYVAGLVFFHSTVSDQFWVQTDESPLFGAGWQASDGAAESFPVDQHRGKSARQNLASEHVLGLPTVNSTDTGTPDAGEIYNPNDVHNYWGNYGGRR